MRSVEVAEVGAAVAEVEVVDVILAISDEKVMVGEKTETVKKKVVAVQEKTESPRRSP